MFHIMDTPEGGLFTPIQTCPRIKNYSHWKKKTREIYPPNFASMVTAFCLQVTSMVSGKFKSFLTDFNCQAIYDYISY